MTITVRLGARSYPILIADSYRGLPAALARLRLPREGWLVSHRALVARHGRALRRVLLEAGWHVRVLTIPESETAKSLATVERLLRAFAGARRMRTPLVLAFGGGVVGDVAGFAAAVYRRGVPYVQLPTTLLAQVDSAIGGKTGVDVSAGKNLVGAFHQPRLVYNNVSLLRTLPPRQRRSGLAEVIKYGVIADPALFRYLEEHPAECLALEPRAVRVLVERSCRIKAAVVAKDERDVRGARAALNFGHTLGHALEAAGRYRRWTHGEAIAIGMCAAAALAADAGYCDEGLVARLVRLCRRYGLPTHAQRTAWGAVAAAMRLDKKFVRGRPRWVLPRRLGRVVVTEALRPAQITRMLRRSVRGSGTG